MLKQVCYSCAQNMRAKIILLAVLSLLISLTRSRVALAAMTTPVAGVHGALPSSLYIPKINKVAFVIPVGLTTAGDMDVPHNFIQAGWYQFGVLPGKVGSAIIDGHVDNGASIPGVFKHLHELAVGDDIYVTDQSGNILHFKVTGTTVYRRTSSSAPIFANAGIPLLKIITCYGTFIPKDKTYDRRLVITASLVG